MGLAAGRSLGRRHTSANSARGRGSYHECERVLEWHDMAEVEEVYKIVPRREWEARGDGGFRGSEVDLRDGYIHFSTLAQLAETARRHFAGQTDLLLVAVSVSMLGDALRWERSRGGELFPHLYASLPDAAVLWTRSFSATEHS